MRQRKAILYIRVSTDEQAEKGHSLTHQEERLRHHCATNGIEVVGLYREDHSAKSFERPEFRKILEFLKKHKDAADLLLFLKWDRFSRNAPEAYHMIGVLRKFRTEPQAIEQPLDLNVPENKIMLALYLTTPEVENDRRSLNVIAGMRRALKDGRWMGHAPTGYANKRDENNRPCLIPSKDAPLVKVAFEQLATGQYNIEAARRYINGKGLKISRNAFWHMIQNPIYIGKLYVPAYKDEDASIVPGKHDPIISESLYYEVQDVISGRRRIGVATHHCKQEPLPLRGFLKCAKCGRTLSGSGSKGNGGTYYYYHCFNGCKERFKAPLANELFYDLLRQISGNKKLLKTLEYISKDHYKKHSNEQAVAVDLATKELETYRKRMETAQMLMLDGQIDSSEYRNIKHKLEPEIERLVRKQTKAGETNPQEQEMLEFGFYFLNNMVELFAGAGLEAKHQIIGSMFPEKLVFENMELRTNVEDGIIPLLLNTSAAFSQKKKGETRKLVTPSQQVVPAGFEPEQTVPKTVVLPLHHRTNKFVLRECKSK